MESERESRVQPHGIRHHSGREASTTMEVMLFYTGISACGDGADRAGASKGPL